jgi:cell division protein ZapD
VILYEHPFNERVRTYLRLEHLFHRFDELITREQAVDHHFALTTLFELVDVGGRADLKTEVLKDLEKNRQQFLSFRGNPSVSEAALNEVIAELDTHLELLKSVSGRIGQAVTDNEWLSSLRNRSGIPGGTCGFDLPYYHAWQQHPSVSRCKDLKQWGESLRPIQNAVNLLLRLLRENGMTQKVVATAGQFQQALPQGRFQLMRLRLDPQLGLIPEISGNRLMIWVRMMQADETGRMQACTQDVTFEVALCV